MSTTYPSKFTVKLKVFFNDATTGNPRNQDFYLHFKKGRNNSVIWERGARGDLLISNSGYDTIVSQFIAAAQKNGLPEDRDFAHNILTHSGVKLYIRTNLENAQNGAGNMAKIKDGTITDMQVTSVTTPGIVGSKKLG